MELIRLYYDSIDVKPSVLIRHFARYLGIYVEENPDRDEDDSDNVSLAEIYIISDAYFGETEGFLDVSDEDRAILVLKDHFKTDDQRIKAVYYDDDADDANDKEFLCRLLDEICGLIETYDTGQTVLMQSGAEYRAIIHYVISAYLESNILQASLFNRCFYKEKRLYHMASDKYKRFILDVERGFSYFRNSDLLEYVLLYAKYEMNIICKKNLYNYPYSSDDLMDQCEELLGRHPENEELYLLKADIQFELQDRWLWACDDFADPHIMHYAYAEYRRGKILRLYLEEYIDAEYLLKGAVKKNRNYVYAWYQLGICYDEQAKYKEAVDAFHTIVEILKERYTRQLLAPVEVEYLYKAVMQIANVHKNRLEDYTSAYAYDYLAKDIRNHNAIKGYLERLWKDQDSMEDVEAFQIIDNALKKEIDLKLEEIY